MSWFNMGGMGAAGQSQISDPFGFAASPSHAGPAALYGNSSAVGFPQHGRAAPGLVGYQQPFPAGSHGPLPGPYSIGQAYPRSMHYASPRYSPPFRTPPGSPYPGFYGRPSHPLGGCHVCRGQSRWTCRDCARCISCNANSLSCPPSCRNCGGNSCNGCCGFLRDF